MKKIAKTSLFIFSRHVTIAIYPLFNTSPQTIFFCQFDHPPLVHFFLRHFFTPFYRLRISIGKGVRDFCRFRWKNIGYDRKKLPKTCWTDRVTAVTTFYHKMVRFPFTRLCCVSRRLHAAAAAAAAAALLNELSSVAHYRIRTHRLCFAAQQPTFWRWKSSGCVDFSALISPPKLISTPDHLNGIIFLLANTLLNANHKIPTFINKIGLISFYDVPPKKRAQVDIMHRKVRLARMERGWMGKTDVGRFLASL